MKKANEYSIEAVQKDEDFREWSNVIAKISENIQNGIAMSNKVYLKKQLKNYEIISKDHPYFPDAEFYKGLTRFSKRILKVRLNL